MKIRLTAIRFCWMLNICTSSESLLNFCVLSLWATPNSPYTKGDRAFRASKSMSVSLWDSGTAFSFWVQMPAELHSGPFWSTSQPCAIIHFSATWFPCIPNLPRLKKSCCMLQELTQAGTVDFNPPPPQFRNISRTGRKLKTAAYQTYSLFYIAITHKGSYQGLSLQKRCLSIKNKDGSNPEKQ